MTFIFLFKKKEEEKMPKQFLKSLEIPISALKKKYDEKRAKSKGRGDVVKEREFCKRDQPRRWLYRGLSVWRGKKAFRIDLGYLQVVLFSTPEEVK